MPAKRQKAARPDGDLPELTVRRRFLHKALCEIHFTTETRPAEVHNHVH